MRISPQQVIFTLLTLFIVGVVTSQAQQGEARSEKLVGSQEVPAVETAASGAATITVDGDRSVHGVIETRGIAGTMAHIHEGSTGQNGPAIVTLTALGADRWVVPANMKLTEGQYTAWKSGKLYVNVHSAAHKAGEIRAQLVP